MPENTDWLHRLPPPQGGRCNRCVLPRLHATVQFMLTCTMVCCHTSRYAGASNGPIVITQIENEYGSFGNCASNPNDAKYMHHLLDLATAAMPAGMLYSTIDGGEGSNPAKLGHGNAWPV